MTDMDDALAQDNLMMLKVADKRKTWSCRRPTRSRAWSEIRTSTYPHRVRRL